MAMSSCVKCGSHTFEIKAAEPKNATYKQIFIQCSSCGGVAGVVGYYDAGAILKEQQQEIADLKKTIRRIDQYVQQIASRMR